VPYMVMFVVELNSFQFHSRFSHPENGNFIQYSLMQLKRFQIILNKSTANFCQKHTKRITVDCCHYLFKKNPLLQYTQFNLLSCPVILLKIRE
jgi:hypothetical protein